jgi:1-acyl-sn-glycerol-3-phosphate acyltransferase
MNKFISIFFKLYLGILFLVTLLLLYVPILLLLLREKTKKKAFPLFVFWCRLLCFLAGYRVKPKHAFSVPEGPCIFISNHTSFLDIVFMYLLFPTHPFLFLGKAELLKVPLVKTFFKRLHIPVYRNKGGRNAHKALEAADQALKQGWSIIIFPEGGIKEHLVPVLQVFKDGAFRLAKNNQVPIVPITFLNNYELLEDPAVRQSVARPGTAQVVVHPIIDAITVTNTELEDLKLNAFETINAPLLIKS